MNAVIYACYSSEGQREESIDGQIRESMEYYKQNGMTEVKEYIDRAFSAKTDNRPDFQRMIKGSAKGLFDVVVVWKLDRFARNRYDSAHYKVALKKNGVRVVSAKENIADDPESIILESMLEGMSEYYSAELSTWPHGKCTQVQIQWRHPHIRLCHRHRQALPARPDHRPYCAGHFQNV